MSPCAEATVGVSERRPESFTGAGYLCVLPVYGQSLSTATLGNRKVVF